MSSSGSSVRLAWLVIQLLVLSLLAVAVAREAPQNLVDFYNAVRAKGRCSHELATGFYSRDGGPNTFSYCSDALSTSGVLYLQGRNGVLANLDVDCDGVSSNTSAAAPAAGNSGAAANDGRCRQDLSPDLQPATSFRDVVRGYKKPGVPDLNPYVHPYVVFGNAPGTRHRRGWRSFDPTKYGMRPLSVMAVLCPDRKTLVYGVWGDTNGDDGEKPMVGEASLALGTACGGKRVHGNSGIDEDAVLFLGFTGEEAVPGPEGADWAAKDFDAFERSIEGLGDRLVQRVKAQVGDGTTESGGGSPDSAASAGFKQELLRAAAALVAVLLGMMILK